MNRDRQFLLDMLQSTELSVSYNDAIDLNIVWDAIQTAIPNLIEVLKLQIPPEQ
jgi:uncharacterized protein with HEPN domain